MKLLALFNSELKNFFLKDIKYDYIRSFIKILLSSKDVLCLDYEELYYKYGFYGLHNYVREYIKENGIDCVLCNLRPDEFYFDVNFFEEIRREVFLVMKMPDSEYYHEVVERYYAQAMDLAILHDYITGVKLHQIGINSIVDFGEFDSSEYRKIENLPKDIDVSFVGQLCMKGRLEYINYLLENNIKIEVFGKDSIKGVLPVEEKINIYNRSKINLNFAGIYEDYLFIRKHKILSRAKQLKGRPFEAAMCGGFVLSEYAPGLENAFRIGKEIDVFHNKEELLEKVKYYLENEEERENIAKRGYERAIRDYDIKKTLPKLLSTIDELRKKKIYKPSEIYLDEQFIRHYTTFRVLWIIRFIKRRKLKFALEELKIVLKYRKLDYLRIRIFLTEEILDKFPKLKSILKKILKRKTPNKKYIFG